MPFSAPQSDLLDETGVGGFKAPEDEIVSSQPAPQPLAPEFKPVTTLGELPSVMFGMPEESKAIATAETEARKQFTTPRQAAEAADAISRKWDAIIQMTRESRPENVPAMIEARNQELRSIGSEPVELNPTIELPKMAPEEVTSLTGIKGRPSAAIASAQRGVSGVAESFVSPEALPMFISPPAVAGVFARGFIGQMAASLPKSLVEAASYYKSGDTQRGDEALINAGITAGMLAVPAVAGRLKKPTLEQIVGEQQAKQIRDLTLTGEDIKMPAGAIPPQIPTTGVTFKGVPEELLYTKSQKPTIPETAAEPYETSIQAIKRTQSKTIKQIQQLFPMAELTREQARVLRDQAWGKPTTVQPYASKIESTKPVPEHEVRTQVGTKTPLRQPDQGTAIPRTAERPSAETGKEGNAVVATPLTPAEEPIEQARLAESEQGAKTESELPISEKQTIRHEEMEITGMGGGKVNISVRMRYDPELKEWLVTPEGHESINNAKKLNRNDLEEEANEVIRAFLNSKRPPKTIEDAWNQYRKYEGADSRQTPIVGKSYFTDAWNAFNKPERQTLENKGPVPSEPVATSSPVQAKEPWQMTRSDFDSKSTQKPSGKDSYLTDPNGRKWLVPGTRSRKAALDSIHKNSVKYALSEGKPVPAEVLADYPDLANKPPKPSVSGATPSPVLPEGTLEKTVPATTETVPTISVTPKTGKTQAPLEILNSAKQVKVTAPKSATMVRVTDSKGKTATQSLASVQGENVFQGAGITKIEAGIIGKDKKFKPVKGEVTVEDKTPFPPGPGAMTVGEFESQRPPEKPGEKIYGISQAARESRAAAGQVPAIEPGEGITGEESVARGRELLRQGYDAPAALARFEATGAVEPDAVMATRAYGENLAAKARQAEKTFGTASNEFIEAYQALAEWDRATKPMATQLHRGFVAHQGKTDIDTGTYTGLARAFRDSTGKDFTPEQTVKAKQIASEVSRADVAQEKALKKLYDTLQKETGVETRPAYKPTETDVKSTLEGIKKIFANQKAGQKFTTEQVRALWQYAKDVYVDKGNIDFPQLLTNLAVDTGLPRSEVARALAQPKAVRAITDEIYKKMSNRRRAVDQAKAWLKNQEVPGWLRFIKSIPRIFFINKIFGHGTVGMITHAGLNIFNPTAWKTYWPNFFKQFGYVFKPSYHERAMQDLMADPNFVLARRAGLVNDPFRFADDYQNATMKTFMGKLGGLVGNRGFDALKTFRQARFNQIWDGLPQSLKTKDMASLIADSVNHATGVVKTSLPGPYQEAASITFFAPKLL